MPYELSKDHERAEMKVRDAALSRRSFLHVPLTTPFPDSGDALGTAAFWHERFPDETLVYFIQGRQGTPIKIGSALNVATRLATFQTAQAQELRVHCVLLGGMKLERDIHRNLRSSKVRGEWFQGEEVNALLARAWDQQDAELEEYRQTGELPESRLTLDPTTQRSARHKWRTSGYGRLDRAA